jgi:hypothetical protein
MPVALVLRHLGSRISATWRQFSTTTATTSAMWMSRRNPHDHPEPDLVVVLGGDSGCHEKEAHRFLVTGRYLRDPARSRTSTLGSAWGTS